MDNGNWQSRLSAIGHPYRSGIALAVYGSVAALAYLAAYLLRFEFTWRSEYTNVILVTLPLLVAIRLGCSIGFSLSTGRWRFVSTPDVVRLAGATTVGSVIFVVAVWLIPLTPSVPRSVILIEWVLSTYFTAGVWLAYRTTFERLRHYRAGFNGRAKRVLIVGAGEAGNMLAREMHRFPTGYNPVGFVDDDPNKRGSTLYGIRVLGTSEDLATIALAAGAQEIVIAVPSATPAELRRIVGCCEATALSFKVLPGISEVLAGEVRVAQLREMRIEDLLGREPIQLELPELAEDLGGRSVLITGAAGSIGSELARQVALHGPGRLVLFDQAESELYFLELELRDAHPDLEMVSVVGDIVDDAAVEDVFTRFTPVRVFHAAAYKHVPMMEANPREAVQNNVVGTWKVADAAGRHGADRFILVSTDKAVRPASVMGATKRLAEIVVLELEEIYRGTVYGAVRFGNVLGSSGSVIPIFRRQLERGIPLTVTHPDATRYFMTIPEAVQLILQASLLPDLAGRVAMLDMGKPVRILDLAKKLLQLSGSRADPSTSVRFTGLRPGERLHEELLAPEETTLATGIPKVRLVLDGDRNGRSAVALVRMWEGYHENGQAAIAVLEELRDLFPSLVTNDENGAMHLDSLYSKAASARTT